MCEIVFLVNLVVDISHLHYRLTSSQIIFRDFKLNERLRISAIYKTRNTETGDGMRVIWGSRGMFTRIPGNLLEHSGECYYFKILGNVQEDSGECSRRFRGILVKIPWNVEEDFGECWQRFRGMLAKVLENAQEHLTFYNAIKRK